MKLKAKLERIILKASKKSPHLQVYIKSNQLNDPFIYSLKGSKQAFHSASVGKLATAFATIQFIQRKKILFDTPIHSLIEVDLLSNLFVYQGVDYSKQVTIRHLLGHTSGVNDYFEGITDDKSSIVDYVLANPNHRFKPIDLIQYTATKQHAIEKPGEKFLYSDTGYVLLAFILEALAMKPFYQILREEVFEPLQMNDTGLLFYDPIAKQEELAPVILKSKDIHLNSSLSVDYAGGGLHTTLEDLAKLVQGLLQRDYIQESIYDKITEFHHHFNSGMFYGLGLMELRFEKMFFLLKGLPRLQGHLGVLGVHAWVNPLTGDTIVMNVSNMDQMIASFKILIPIVMELNKAYKNKTN